MRLLTGMNEEVGNDLDDNFFSREPQDGGDFDENRRDYDDDDDYDGSLEPDDSGEGTGPDEEAEALGDLYASQYD